eukprot:scaffold95825_cov59-Attheya_sp.AAC.3
MTAHDTSSTRWISCCRVLDQDHSCCTVSQFKGAVTDVYCRAQAYGLCYPNPVVRCLESFRCPASRGELLSENPWIGMQCRRGAVSLLSALHPKVPSPRSGCT